MTKCGPQKSGLPIADVRAIRISAGIGDTTPNSRLDSIDASSFKQRNHGILVLSVSAASPYDTRARLERLHGDLVVERRPWSQTGHRSTRGSPRSWNLPDRRADQC